MSTGPSSRVLRSAKRLTDRPRSSVESEDASRHAPRQGLHTAHKPSKAGVVSADSKPAGTVSARDYQSALLDGVSPVKSEDAIRESVLGYSSMLDGVSPVKSEDAIRESVLGYSSMLDSFGPVGAIRESVLGYPSMLDGFGPVKSEGAAGQGLRGGPSRTRSARHKPYELHLRPGMSSRPRKQATSITPNIRAQAPCTTKGLIPLPAILPSSPSMATMHHHPRDTSPQSRKMAVSAMSGTRPGASVERREPATPTARETAPLPAVPSPIPSVSVSVQAHLTSPSQPQDQLAPAPPCPAHSIGVNVNVAITLSPRRNP